ncbi:hypothetical protein BU17DRAFT_37290 [Hysterangium stoloniferum]|nr:hypothetical protein BU17DRAFT_37290 [Hysterangium stoloniferum]
MSEQEDQTSLSQDKNEDEAILTPLRTHYLKKTLINLQFHNELTGLTQLSPNPAISPFSYLGEPFTPPPKDAPVLDFPFMRYIFRQFVLTFPFLAAVPKSFFPQKVQPFLSSFLTRNLSTSSPFDEEAERTEQATREKILSRIQKQFGLLLASALKLKEQEELVRLTQKDLDRLETLAKRRNRRVAKLRDSFDVNIVSIRTVIDKGRVRSKLHEEFLIRTRRSNRPDIFVSRRYGDFRTLAEELRKAYPDSLVPPPPAKDRSTVAAPLASPSPTQSFGSVSADHHEPENLSRTATIDSVYSNEVPSAVSSAARLAREKNRLTLRSYLHTLLSSSTFASSDVLRSFLTAGPTRLSSSEMEDAHRREEADQIREEGRKRFAKELAAKVDCLRDAIKNVKGEVLEQNGLRHVFAIIKSNPDVSNLPRDFKAVLEWGRISLASTIFGHFVAADSASQSLATLKRVHGLMPYFMLKGILKISNPVSMIRGVLELFLAQPFGGRSLLQRMFTSSLAEEVKALQEDIEAVRDKVEDPILCEKVRLFVYAPTEIQTMLKADAEGEKLPLLTIILRSSEDPILSRAQLQRVFRAHRAHAEYKRHQETLNDSDDDDGPQDDDAWLYEDLHVLGKLYSRLREREQLMELIFEGTTADLLKDIITIFYSPLAQVYKAASIADSLGDLQNFINDLIKTVEYAEGMSSSQQDPASNVKMFIDLVQRHEQSFYYFVHKVHSKGAGLFDGLLRWIELFINFVREGLGQPISLEFLLPHTGPERINILREVDAVALYHYRLKVAHESKVRRRFEQGEASNNGTTTADEDDEATQVLIDDVARDFSFGELVHADADDFSVEDSSEEDSEESETDGTDESDSDGSEEGQSARVMSASSPVTQRMPTTAPLLLHHQKTRASMDGPPQPPPKEVNRRRALSLRSTKSSSGMRQGRGSGEKIPPVPPLPPKDHPLQFAASAVPPLPSKHAPPQPDIRHGYANPKSHASLQPDASPPRKVSKKKQAPDIKFPDLKFIPELLPLFIEMVSAALSHLVQVSNQTCCVRRDRDYDLVQYR